MQTFMPHDTYEASARALDDKRLKNQSNEALVILRTLLGEYPRSKKTGRPGGWPNHPATKMWRGYEVALCRYALKVCAEKRRRGLTHGSGQLPVFAKVLDELKESSASRGDPPWMGRASLHAAHRATLLRKDPEHYRRLWPDGDADLAMVWP